MVGARWPENDCGEEDEYISGDCAQKKLNGKMDHGWEKQRPRCKKLSRSPIIFSGLIRWEADLGPCGFRSHNITTLKKQSTVRKRDSVIGRIS